MAAAWSDTDVQKLRDLVAGGRDSAAAIGAKLGGKFTRSAILGKVFRLGLTMKVAAAKRKPAPRLPRAAKPSMERSPVGRSAVPKALPFVPRAVPAGAPTSPPVRFLKLSPNDCRYAMGPVLARPEWFCGAPQQDGSAYCGFHHSVCHTRPQVFVRRPATRVVPDRRYAALEAAE